MVLKVLHKVETLGKDFAFVATASHRGRGVVVEGDLIDHLAFLELARHDVHTHAKAGVTTIEVKLLRCRRARIYGRGVVLAQLSVW